MDIQRLCLPHIRLFPGIFKNVLLAEYLFWVFQKQFQNRKFLFGNTGQLCSGNAGQERVSVQGERFVGKNRLFRSLGQMAELYLYA